MSWIELIAFAVDTVLALALARFLQRGFSRAFTEHEKAEWRQLAPKRRKEIARAVRRGEGVRDPRDAKQAVALIDRADAAEKILLSPILLMIGLLETAVSMAAFAWTRSILAAGVGALGLLGVGGWLVGRLTQPGRVARLQRARAANTALTGFVGAEMRTPNL